MKLGPKRSSPCQRAIPPNCRPSPSLTASLATRLLLRTASEAQRLTRRGQHEEGRPLRGWGAVPADEAQEPFLDLELPVGQKPGADAAAAELLVLQDRQVERDGRLGSRDGELVQGPQAPPDRGPAVPGVHDQLR